MCYFTEGASAKWEDIQKKKWCELFESETFLSTKSAVCKAMLLFTVIYQTGNKNLRGEVE